MRPPVTPDPPGAAWFIGLPVAPGAWHARLQPPPGHKGVVASDLHLTVVYLGAVGQAAALAAWHALGTLPARTAALGPVVAFGRPAAYSALAAEVADPGLCAFIEAQRNPLRALVGQAPENREPRPHLTVARPRATCTNADRAAGVAWAAALGLLGTPITLNRIALFTWSDHPGAGTYRIVEEATLQQPCR